MSGTRQAWALLGLALSLSGPLTARADAVITLNPSGAAFTDPTPAAPIGGNKGKTLGAQRLNALQYAADLWGAQLDSDAPIAVDVSFADLGCGATGAVLAHAGPTTALNGLDNDGADPAIWYPAALANRLAGQDLFPGQAEIVAEVNSAADQPDCFIGGWYYGLDGKPNGKNDLVEVALHEFAHGLGFTAFVDTETGEMLTGSEPDAFTSHVVDVASNQAWPFLTNEQRVVSTLTARGVSWSGKHTTAAAKKRLDVGAPSLTFDPEIPGFSGFVADAGFANVTSTVIGPLVVSEELDGCTPPALGSLEGKVVLYEPQCSSDLVADNAAQAGAIGVLLIVSGPFDSPAFPLPDSDVAVTIPVLTLSPADGALVEAAVSSGAVDAIVTLDPDQRKGVDDRGRPLLFTSQPRLGASAVSHFDVLARPDLLMEPYASADVYHKVDLTKAFMIDLGWTPFCGNGRIDQDEQCDDAASNDDGKPNACRTDCTRAHCGDAVIDRGEICDDGPRNSDSAPNACRTSCREASCGDGTIDEGEACDDGAANSDTEPSACRTRCVKPTCGDGVVDEGEDCDSKEAACKRCQLPPSSSADAESESDGGIAAWGEGAGGVEESKKKDGCGCRIVGASNETHAGPLALFALSATAWWRRRSRSHRAG